MDDAYARKKLEEIYSKIPVSSIYNTEAADLIRVELLSLIGANSVLKYEFGIRSTLKSADQFPRNHIDSAFQNVRTILDEPDAAYLNNRIYPPSLGDDLRIVVRALMRHVRTLDKPKILKMVEVANTRKKRGSSVLYRGNNLYEFKKKEYRQKNWSYARLCGFVYDRCRPVGSKIEVEEVYKFMRPERDYFVHKAENWKWISGLVRGANRWAQGNKLPELMKCEKNHVVRLGIR